MTNGFRLGRYQLKSKLAVGGMAEIWLAEQAGPAGFSKQLVIKKILPHLASDKAFVDMFLNEGRVAALINHPNVVQVFELSEQGNDYYLVMEHVAGWSLRTIVMRSLELHEPMPIAVVAHLAIDLCHGLHAAHELVDAGGKPLGLVHRDVSPENVLVTRSGQAKVTDFGIAKATAAASGTRPGELKGKMAYMPPEQLLGKPLDRRTDLYAAGATLYELISGQRAFEVPGDAALSMSILQERPVPLRTRRPDVPPELEVIVDKAMSKDAKDRYATALEMAHELEGLVARLQAPNSAVAQWLRKIFPAEAVAPMATPLPGTARLEAVAPHDAPAAVVAAAAARGRRWPLALGAVLIVAAGAGVLMRALAPAPAAPVAAAEPAPAPVAVPTTPVAVAEAPKAVEPVPVTPAPASAPVSAKHGKTAHGRLLVRVSPWADVVVDGRMVGATPLAPLELTAGRHSVTVTNSELGKTRTVAVEIRASRQELVEINLK